MPVQEQTPYIKYVANGATQTFSTEFDCESKDQLVVMLNGEEPAFTSWSYADKQVTFVTAPVVDTVVELKRQSKLNRTTDYQSFNHTLNYKALNSDFDRIWYAIQDQNYKVGQYDYDYNFVLTQVRPIATGGTGANNVFNARSNLDVYSKSEVLALVQTGGAGEVLSIESGGTSGVTAEEARTNLDVYSKTESNSLALPLGTPIWHNGTRLTIDDGYASYDGQLLNRADFPSLWAKVQSKFVVITDADWLADPKKRAAYSSGNGTTTFRMPDLNGFLSDSIKGLFLRGDGNGTIAGETVLQSTILTDAIRNIKGTFIGGSNWNNTALFTRLNTVHPSIAGGGGASQHTYEFNASLVVPTANENRPVSAVGIWICRVSAGTAEQVLPNTAPSLTGGNTWGGSQKVTGNLEVTGTLNADIKPLLNASGSLPIYALRSWGIVEGTATPARLVKGGNIASVVDEGVGQYKITFATPMPDLNYGVLFGSTTYTLNDAGTYGTMKIGTKTVNGFIISCGQQGYVDVPAVSFGVIY